MKFPHLLLLLMLSAQGVLQGQRIILPLTQRAEDSQYGKLMLVTPVFGFMGDSVANPLDVSAGTDKNPVFLRKVILPAFDKGFAAGYAWVFNGAALGGFNASHTLIGVQNPSLTFHPTIIWTDRNNNLNLTDDGPPDTMTVTKGVTLRLSENKNGYKVFLQHFPDEQFPLFAIMNDAEMYKIKGSRPYFGTSGSFRERRLNVLAGKWNNGLDSFSLAIKDVNCNGVYGDAGVDEAMITNFNGTFDNLQSVELGKSGKTYLEWGNSSYHLIKVDAEGRFVELQRDTSSDLQFSLNKGKKLPKFKYCTATKPQKHMSIRKYRGSYTYIYIWRDGVIDFLRDSADLHALAKIQSADFKVLTLNYGASGNYVYKYNRIYRTTLQQGFGSNRINKALKIKKIPHGILIDKRQRIIANGITPAQAKQIILSRKQDKK